MRKNEFAMKYYELSLIDNINMNGIRWLRIHITISHKMTNINGIDKCNLNLKFNAICRIKYEFKLV